MRGEIIAVQFQAICITVRKQDICKKTEKKKEQKENCKQKGVHADNERDRFFFYYRKCLKEVVVVVEDEGKEDKDKKRWCILKNNKKNPHKQPGMK